MNRRRPEWRGVLAVVLAAAAVLLVTALREHFGQRAGVTAPASRRPMADLDLPLLGGGAWHLGEHRGEVVAINLWATWCAPCREEIPLLVRSSHDLAPSGFTVVGVSLDNGAREAKVCEFARQFRISYPLAFPDALSQMSAGMEGIPTTLLIDRRGRLARTYVGELRESVLRKDVATLLSEQQ